MTLPCNFAVIKAITYRIIIIFLDFLAIYLFT